MSISQDQIDELKQHWSDAKVASEGGATFILIPRLELPAECMPNPVEALLCPMPRDGYQSRLFFAVQIEGGRPHHWNAQNVLILERNWFAFSWKAPLGLRLVQMLLNHVSALKPLPP